MVGIERTEFGYPIFEPFWPERSRRGVRDLLERFAGRTRQTLTIPEETMSEWELPWIDLGGEG